ncbi:MAG: hypothetical protein AAF990_19775 [Bacteroidota bacterium]
MFNSLPHYFRKYRLQSDVRTLLLLRKSLQKGLVHTLGDLYYVLKGIITNSPQDYGPFTTAFYDYFLDIDIRPGESLENAVLRSEAFSQWKEKYLENIPEEEQPGVKQLIDDFLNEVHFTTYDIQQMLSGADILREDDPNQADSPGDGPDQMPERLEQAADYSQMSLEELLERMRQVARQQQREHRGGSHWIGQGGISPYGNQGAAKGGIRAGGTGGGKMARKVIGNKNFYPVDTKVALQDNNIDVALSYLKGIEEESAELLLDIPKTIKEGVKEGGLFLPHQKEKIDKKVQVILMIDNGGWSMSGYIKNVTKLFSKMERRFAHDLKTYYYHNTIYGGVYSDSRRTQFEPLSKILDHSKNYSLFIIGDADMAPYELDQSSLNDWQALHDAFPRTAWLNPMDLRYWPGSYTVNVLRKIFSMFPLTPDGIEKAVQLMNRKKKFGR